MSKIFISNLPVVTIAIEAASQRALIAAADVGRNQTVQNLAGARSGRTYKVPGTQVTYTASAPGEYPAVATGNLRERVERKVVGGDVQVGTAVEYGLILEKGGGRGRDEHGRFTAGMKRPWLKRSLDEAKPAMLAKLAQRWF